MQRLAEVFTLDIWCDRPEEMNELWDHVPLRYRGQVDIEALRREISIRDKFNLGKEGNQWEQGF